MKKIFLSVLAIASMAMTANAQLWFGGGISFSHNGGVTKTNGADDVDKPSSNSFSFSPTVGFDLSEKLAVGGKLNFLSTTGKQTNGNTETKTSDFMFGITPFARYKFVEFNKFGIIAEAGAPISHRSHKNDNGSTTTKGDPTMSVGLYVEPVLTYSLNDHFQLECGLDFMSFNATHSVTKDRDDSSNKDINNYFRFGANTYNVVTISNITIGFIYKL
jgi:outer membrane protein